MENIFKNMTKNISCRMILGLAYGLIGNVVPGRLVFQAPGEAGPKAGDAQKPQPPAAEVSKEKILEVTDVTEVAKNVEGHVKAYQDKRVDFKNELQELADFIDPAKAMLKSTKRGALREKYGIGKTDPNEDKDDRNLTALAKKAAQTLKTMDMQCDPMKNFKLNKGGEKVAAKRTVDNIKKLKGIIEKSPKAQEVKSAPAADLTDEEKEAFVPDNVKQARLEFKKVLFTARAIIGNTRPNPLLGPVKFDQASVKLQEFEDKYAKSTDLVKIQEGMREVKTYMDEELKSDIEHDKIRPFVENTVREYFKLAKKDANPRSLIETVKMGFDVLKIKSAGEWEVIVDGITIKITHEAMQQPEDKEKEPYGGGFKLTMSGDPETGITKAANSLKIKDAYPAIGEYLKGKAENVANKLKVTLPAGNEQATPLTETAPGWLLASLSKLTKAWDDSAKEDQAIKLDDGSYTIAKGSVPKPLKLTRGNETYIINAKANPDAKSPRKWLPEITKVVDTKNFARQESFVAVEDRIGKVHDFKTEAGGDKVEFHVLWDTKGETPTFYRHVLPFKSGEFGRPAPKDFVIKNNDRIVKVTKTPQGKLEYTVFKREVDARGEYLKKETRKKEDGTWKMVDKEPMKIPNGHGEAANFDDLIRQLQELKDKEEAQAERQADELQKGVDHAVSEIIGKYTDSKFTAEEFKKQELDKPGNLLAVIGSDLQKKTAYMLAGHLGKLEDSDGTIQLRPDKIVRIPGVEEPVTLAVSYNKYGIILKVKENGNERGLIKLAEAILKGKGIPADIEKKKSPNADKALKKVRDEIKQIKEFYENPSAKASVEFFQGRDVSNFQKFAFRLQKDLDYAINLLVTNSEKALFDSVEFRQRTLVYPSTFIAEVIIAPNADGRLEPRVTLNMAMVKEIWDKTHPKEVEKAESTPSKPGEAAPELTSEQLGKLVEGKVVGMLDGYAKLTTDEMKAKNFGSKAAFFAALESDLKGIAREHDPQLKKLVKTVSVKKTYQIPGQDAVDITIKMNQRGVYVENLAGVVNGLYKNAKGLKNIDKDEAKNAYETKRLIGQKFNGVITQFKDEKFLRGKGITTKEKFDAEFKKSSQKVVDGINPSVLTKIEWEKIGGKLVHQSIFNMGVTITKTDKGFTREVSLNEALMQSIWDEVEGKLAVAAKPKKTTAA